MEFEMVAGANTSRSGADGIGLREIGALARATERSELSSDPEAVKRKDRRFQEGGGSLARYAQTEKKAPLSAARELVDIGLMSQRDPRFLAAFSVRIDASSQSRGETPDVMKALGGYAQALREEGDRKGFLRLRAISEADRRADLGEAAAALEEIAMSLPDKSDLPGRMLKDSVRIGEAHHFENCRAKEGPKRSKPHQR